MIVLVALGAGIAAGVLLDLLTVLVARYGPEGSGWSLRGNGALVVPFGLVPALLILAIVRACFTRGSARSVGLQLVAALAFAVALVVSLVLTSRVFPPGV